MKNKSNDKIDFVVLWVDPNDKEWQKERAKYSKDIVDVKNVDNREERYRDWDLFKYWFRGVEKYAPWVNKVHLVTCGHLPEWLNVNHPKLHIVKHSDFMPKEALPTFNSNAIELCIHKIPGLAEHFVVFNDDMFLMKKVRPTDFFKNGVPVNTMSLFASMPCKNGNYFYKVPANNVAIINKHFDFDKAKKKHLAKYLSLKQKEWLLFTAPAFFYNQFIGFRNYHIPISYLKRTFLEVWEKEPEVLSQTVFSRFRDNEKNVSHWLFNYWQFASGTFKQRNANFGKSVSIINANAPSLIKNRKKYVICLNDADDVYDYEKIRNELMDSFNANLLGKSCYEK